MQPRGERLLYNHGSNQSKLQEPGTRRQTTVSLAPFSQSYLLIIYCILTDEPRLWWEWHVTRALPKEVNSSRNYIWFFQLGVNILRSEMSGFFRIWAFPDDLYIGYLFLYSMYIRIKLHVNFYHLPVFVCFLYSPSFFLQISCATV